MTDRKEERVIKVTRCGDQAGCAFDDRISIEFSPSELSSLEIDFKEAAMKVEKYDKQTEMRELYDTFKRAYDMWDNYERILND